MPEQLIETRADTTLTEAAGGKYLIDLITPGWGSSGFYGAPMLEAAGRDRVFPAGTHMYIDHPTPTEDAERPARSLRDLAAVLTTDATWNGQALVAEARVFGPYQELIAEMKDVIGVSIRAGGDVELGEAEGRKGRIVSKLVHATSVDFVTKAGRGGRVAQLLESARPTRAHLAEARNIGQWVESAIHRDFTVMADDMAAQGRLTRDERIAMSAAIGDALAAFVSALETSNPQLYQRDLWDEPAAPAVSEGATAPQHTTNTPQEGLVPELSEAEVTALRDRAALAESEKLRADRAEAALAEADARQGARPAVAAEVAKSTKLGNRTQARVVESVLAALPMKDGAVDTDALPKVIESAVKTAEDELEDYTNLRNGRTHVFGSFGSLAEAHDGTTEVSESDMKTSVGTLFGRTSKES